MNIDEIPSPIVSEEESNSGSKSIDYSCYFSINSSSSDSHACDGWDKAGAKENSDKEEEEYHLGKENWLVICNFKVGLLKSYWTLTIGNLFIRFGWAHKESLCAYRKAFRKRRALKKLASEKVSSKKEGAPNETKAASIVPCQLMFVQDEDKPTVPKSKRKRDD